MATMADQDEAPPEDSTSPTDTSPSTPRPEHLGETASVAEETDKSDLTFRQNNSGTPRLSSASRIPIREKRRAKLVVVTTSRKDDTEKRGDAAQLTPNTPSQRHSVRRVSTITSDVKSPASKWSHSTSSPTSPSSPIMSRVPILSSRLTSASHIKEAIEELVRSPSPIVHSGTSEPKCSKRHVLLSKLGGLFTNHATHRQPLITAPRSRVSKVNGVALPKDRTTHSMAQNSSLATPTPTSSAATPKHANRIKTAAHGSPYPLPVARLIELFRQSAGRETDLERKYWLLSLAAALSNTVMDMKNAEIYAEMAKQAVVRAEAAVESAVESMRMAHSAATKAVRTCNVMNAHLEMMEDVGTRILHARRRR